jgi:hypothetical protein
MNTHPSSPRALLTLAALPLFLFACASTPAPLQELAVAEATVQRASTASTRESAPAELRQATVKLAEARAAAKGGENERARRLAVEAAIDAEVAEMRAQAVRSAKAASETQDAARVLREELSRKSPQ